jgi:hypothetical protein
MPLIKSLRVLAGKLETTPGTGVTLTTGVDGIIDAYDVMIDGEMTYNERVAAGAFGRQTGNVGLHAGSLKFKVPAVGGGTAGTAPAWASVCFESCAMALSAGTFAPFSASATQQAATFGVYENGAIKKLFGAMGTWTFNGEDGKTPYFEFDYKGVWQPPVDGTMFTPQFGTVVPQAFEGATLSFGTLTPRLSKISIAYGATVELRQDAGNAGGYVSAIITGRKTTGKMDPEMTLVAAYDQFGIWIAGTPGALSIAFGAAGAGMTIAAPVCQYTGIKEGDRNGIVTSDGDFQCCQNGSTVDSELTIAF